MAFDVWARVERIRGHWAKGVESLRDERGAIPAGHAWPPLTTWPQPFQPGPARVVLSLCYFN